MKTEASLQDGIIETVVSLTEIYHPLLHLQAVEDHSASNLKDATLSKIKHLRGRAIRIEEARCTPITLNVIP
jgi:hypothetical protein